MSAFKKGAQMIQADTSLQSSLTRALVLAFFNDTVPRNERTTVVGPQASSTRLSLSGSQNSWRSVRPYIAMASGICTAIQVIWGCDVGILKRCNVLYTLDPCHKQTVGEFLTTLITLTEQLNVIKHLCKLRLVQVKKYICRVKVLTVL